MGMPENVFRDGSVEVAVFAKDINYEGKMITVRDYRVQRRYQDKDGEWKNTSSFNFRDLENLSNILDAIRVRRPHEFQPAGYAPAALGGAAA